MSESIKLTIDKNGVANLVFNLEKEKVNKLSAKVMEDLTKALNIIDNNKAIRVLLISSGKKDIFIAGADIEEIMEIKNKPDAYKKLSLSHEIFGKLESLSFPTIAVINGACLGGGLELCLACDYRVVVENKKTILGLPEVNLGIIPGFGGTQRLPKLVGLKESLEIILSGKPIDSRKAFKIGLADAIFREEFLEDSLSKFVSEIIENPEENSALEKRIILRKKRFTSEVIFGQKYLIYYFAKKNLFAKTKGHYPAPIAALEVIKKTYHLKDLAEGLKIESEEFCNLVDSQICKNLINLFFVSEKIKKDSGSDSDVEIKEIKQAGLLGSGVMGGGIAWLFSNYDIPIRMKDISQKSIALGYSQILKIYQQLKKNRKYDDNQISIKMNNITSTTDFSGFNQSDIVIEAIVENMAVKKDVLVELETEVRPDAIIASNSSSLSIGKMSSCLKNPERFAGMHFFNPVNKMPLVEVIRAEKTSDTTIALIVKLSKKLGKTPIVVKDVAGFLVNRVLLPYINEAGFLLMEGAGIANIDQQIENFGMPMGPFTLADTVGIDIGHKVATSLFEAYGSRMRVSPILEEISQNKNFLGKKSGAGFFEYDKNGTKKAVNQEIEKMLKKVRENNGIKKTFIGNKTIIERCLLIMINEAAKCLEEEVVKNASYLDLAMIMGTGFPAFRGGILRYADEYGISNSAEKLKSFHQQYGERFKPADLLIKMAENGDKFYS